MQGRAWAREQGHVTRDKGIIHAGGHEGVAAQGVKSHVSAYQNVTSLFTKCHNHNGKAKCHNNSISQSSVYFIAVSLFRFQERCFQFQFQSCSLLKSAGVRVYIGIFAAMINQSHLAGFTPKMIWWLRLPILLVTHWSDEQHAHWLENEAFWLVRFRSHPLTRHRNWNVRNVCWF